MFFDVPMIKYLYFRDGKDYFLCESCGALIVVPDNIAPSCDTCKIREFMGEVVL